MAKVRSEPKSQGVTLTNGTLFATIYKYDEVNESTSGIEDWYYWLQTSSSGGILDKRTNAMTAIGGNFFATKELAIANPPDGYGDLPTDDEFETKFMHSYMDLFPVAGGTSTEKDASVQRVKDSIDAFVAAGGDGYVLVLRWEEVFKNITEQNANDSSKWARYDSIVNYAKDKGIKVSFRICVDLDDNTLNVNGTGTAFYGLDNQAKDEWGYVGRIEYGFGHCSLNYVAGVEMMLDFVEKALTRYHGILGNQFYWYSVTTTAQQESGYNYENQNYDMGSPGPRYKSGYDYSSHSEAAFKIWCEEKYVTISALNASWNSSFANFSSITLPKSGLSSPGTISETPFLNVFKTNKGKDFWQFTYQTIVSFQTACYNLKPSGVKYFLEYGSCSDVMSALRYSAFISDASNYSDGLKAQFGAFSGLRDLAFSRDVIASNYPKKKGTEINSGDIYRTDGSPSQYGATNIQEMKNIAVQLAKSAIDANGKEFVWISEYSKFSIFTAMVEAMAESKAYSNAFTSSIPIVANGTYKLGEILNDYNSVIQRWRDLTGDTTRRINFVQLPTIDYIGGDENPPNSNVFSLYPISNYSIVSNSIKSVNNYQVVNNSIEYNIANTFYVLIPTHSINYLNEIIAKTTIKIVGSDGIEYVRSTQRDGVFVRGNLNSTQLSYISSNYPSAVFSEDGFANNHPDRRYTGTSGDDATFILPILPYFDITCVNTGSSTVLFDIASADRTNGGLLIRENVPVTAGSSDTYRMYTSFMDGQPWYYRGIKINNNRRNS